MKTRILSLLAIGVFVRSLPGQDPAGSSPGAESAGWVSLFDGKTLDGWTQLNGTASYKVEDGAIVGRTAVGSPNSFLCSNKTFGDFELEFDVKVDTGLNSGVQIRSRQKTTADVAATAKMGKAGAAKPKKAKAAGATDANAANAKKAKADAGANPKKGKANAPDNPKPSRNDAEGRVFGPQVEIEASPGQSGYIYGEATGLGWLSPEPGSKDKAVKGHSYMKNDDWNHFRVIAQGPRIQTFINDHKVADLTNEEVYKTHPKGFIGLQVHTTPKSFQAAWRNIRIRELK